MIDRSGEWWRGTDPWDIDEYLHDFTEDQYPVAVVSAAKCRCGSAVFLLDADDTEGAARRTCVSCRSEHFICDSEEYWDDAEPERCVCPCGNESMNIAVGFALYPDPKDVKWLYVGCRCTACGVLGCYADWKVGYGPSDDFVNKV